MAKVVGVDGCKAGWLAATLGDAQQLSFAAFATMRELLRSTVDAEIITIDIPIGLCDGPRDCDVAARRFISPRSSSVFRAPSRAVFECVSYESARATSIAACGSSLSAQTFAIVPKIREVDELMTPSLQERVREVHPEVCFRGTAGRPMSFHKRDSSGYEERLGVLSRVLPGVTFPDFSAARRTVRGAAADDLLDAAIAAYTALRVTQGLALTLPDDPPLDSRGLRMEMVY